MSKRERKRIQKEIKERHRGKTLQQVIEEGGITIEDLEGGYIGGLTNRTDKSWWRRVGQMR